MLDEIGRHMVRRSVEEDHEGERGGRMRDKEGRGEDGGKTES